jgi:isoleucyl-tRNA synthetase
MSENTLLPEEAPILAGQPLAIKLSDGSAAEITADDLIIKREERQGLVAASENGVTIALETSLTEELEAEGMARELVSKLQNLRKENGFEVTDRIKVTYQTDERTAAMLAGFHDYIANEILAVEFVTGNGETALDVNGSEIKVNVSRA